MKAIELATMDFVKIDGDEPITRLISLLSRTNKDAAVVVDKSGKYMGITYDYYLHRVNIDTSKAKVKNVVVTAPTLNEHDTLEQIASYFYSSNTRILPIVKREKITGVVELKNFIKNIANDSAFVEKKAIDVATKKVISLDENANIGKALHLMRIKKINYIPVVDTKQKLLGVVSFRSILKNHFMLPEKKFLPKRHSRMQRCAAFTERKSFLELPLKEDMQPAKQVDADTPIKEVIKLLIQEGENCVILTSDGKPEGIITPKDIIREFLLSRTERRNLQITNLPKLDPVDMKVVERTLTENYDKFEKIVNNEIRLTVKIKEHRKKGLRKRYEVHSKLTLPGMSINGKSISWNFLRALQESLKAIERTLIQKGKRRLQKG